MSLFVKTEEEQAVEAEHRHVFALRERGTKQIVVGFVAILVVWFIYGRITDTYLLSKKWGPLQADAQGMAVIGTLDDRGSLDRNFFKIVTANQTTRVELTDYGWKEIFNGEEGSINSPSNGDRIQGLLQVDNARGFALLEPFIRYGIAKLMKTPNADALIRSTVAVNVPAHDGKLVESGSLVELLRKYAGLQKDKPESSGDSADGGGSGSNREVEHGVVIPGDSLVRTCPLVLIGPLFVKAELEAQPESALSAKMYKLRLHLNSEGRSRFYQWSRDHNDESLVFILKGVVQTAGKIKQTLDVNYWEISNIRDEQAAKALNDYVNSHVKP